MQSISYYPDIQGDRDWLSFWTLKDFQPGFALAQVEIDYSRKTNFLFVLDKGQAVHCLHQSIITFQWRNVILMLLKKCMCVMWLLVSLHWNVPGFEVSVLIRHGEPTVIG